jgi:NAD(P)-dependent dehydrogenase (short-subunit alcohol dehydrogenase family)
MFSSKWSPDSLPDLTGKVVVVTGGNSGVGAETVEVLAKKGATVYLGARSKSKADAAMKEMKSRVPNGDIVFLPMDLSDFSTVKSAASTFLAKETHLDYLFLNAGIMGPAYSENKEGIEMQWATNYMGHWLLLRELLPILQTSASEGRDVRVVSVSSVGHKLFTIPEGIKFDEINLKDKAPMVRYGQSKLANILLAKELTRRYPAIKAYGVHPGPVRTNLASGTDGTLLGIIGAVAMIFVGINVHDGALTQLHCLSDDCTKESGSYYVPYGKKTSPSKTAEDPELAKKVWDWTDERFKKLGY